MTGEVLLAGAGLPTPAAVRATAASIAAAQHDSGAIPWELEGDTAGKVDAWDHVECAMALLVAGETDAARAAYDWLAAGQRPDGTWPMEWRVGPRGVEVVDPGVEANMCAYVAVGVWHHWLVARDPGFVEAAWPVVAAALDAVVAMQLPGGGIAWGRGSGGTADTALVTGSSSIHHALRCGAAVAGLVDEPRPEWELAADRLAAALVRGDACFEDRSSHAMDWYYPVLGGAVRGEAARARLAARWDDFVVPGLGVRCIDHRPWVTGGETCELALALEALGMRQEAAGLVADVQHLRERDGSYHTGLVYADGKRWPIERSTWTGAALVLATDALLDLTPGADVFRFGAGR